MGLVPGHAYTLIGVYELKDGSGRVREQLVHMRNPWAKESFTGEWRDSSSKWTAEYRAQVPYSRQNEGKFFISIQDFRKAFPLATITYVNDDYNYSYL